MRILYYMPQKFESGSDHLWEIQVSDNMGLRSPWRYGVPSDSKFADKAAIGQKTSGHMSNNVTSWYDGYKINESITSRVVQHFSCFPQWGVPNRWLEFQADGIQ